MRMIINPIYVYEKKAMIRSVKFSIVISLFNALLAFIVLASMSAVIQDVKNTARVQYLSFLIIFRLVALVEFLTVLFIIPAFTAGAISSERERKTLDLLYTTRIRPFDIVFGKFTVAIFTVCTLVVSSLPVLALVFVYGGITAGGVLRLFTSYLIVVYYAGSIGLFASSFSKNTAMAVVIAYSVLIAFILGTLPHRLFFGGLPSENQNQAAVSVVASELMVTYSNQSDVSGVMSLIYSINPVTAFYININSVIGNKESVNLLFDLIGGGDTSFIRKNWFGISMGFQFVTATVLTALSVCNITPARSFGLFKEN